MDAKFTLYPRLFAALHYVTIYPVVCWQELKLQHRLCTPKSLRTSAKRRQCLYTCVPGQLSGDTHVALAGLQAVYGADVVQASAGHIVPRGGVGARHHPGRTQRDGMHLRTRRVRVISSEITIKRKLCWALRSIHAFQKSIKTYSLDIFGASVG